jgi:ribosome modulation factor
MRTTTVDYDRGFKARLAGEALDANPYAKGYGDSRNRDGWNRGWRAADRQLAAGYGLNPGGRIPR